LAGLVVTACGRRDLPTIFDASPGDGGLCAFTFTSTCNPIAQLGIQLDEKCTWVHAPDRRCDHVGSAPIGDQPIGSACAYGLRFDDCVKGAVCSAGICKSICDLQMFGSCASGFACAVADDVFQGTTTPGVVVAGVCDLQ
jgi:hypothetical protein